MAYRSTQRYVRTKKRKAAFKRNAQSERARWRAEPATELQWKVLRRIERETGQKRFADSMTKGKASDLISERLAQDEHAARAHRRSQRARRRAGERTQLGRVA